MPPCLDVYAWTPRRDRATINWFIDRYADRAASADRRDEELSLEPEGYADEHNLELADYEWIPISTLDEAIAIGLWAPPRAFALYLHPSSPDQCSASLCFTRGGELVVGVGLDDPENTRQAEAETTDG